jgi:predicted RNase H-like HicB family nuclease
MKLPKLTAVIEREDDWFVATCPELGVASQARTIEEAERMIKEAVDLLLEDAGAKEISRRLNQGMQMTYFEPPNIHRRRILSAGEICGILQKRGFVRCQQFGSDIVMRKKTPAKIRREL